MLRRTRAGRASESAPARGLQRAHLVQQNGRDHIPDLLLRVLGRRDQAHGLHVTELDVVAQHVDVQQLPHVPARKRACKGYAGCVAQQAARRLAAPLGSASKQPGAHFLRSYGESLSDLNLVRMLASSTLTRFFSSSLLAQLRMSRMKFSSPRGVDAMLAARARGAASAAVTQASRARRTLQRWRAVHLPHAAAAGRRSGVVPAGTVSFDNLALAPLTVQNAAA